MSFRKKQDAAAAAHDDVLAGQVIFSKRGQSLLFKQAVNQLV
jgi:hypothetical protein